MRSGRHGAWLDVVAADVRCGAAAPRPSDRSRLSPSPHSRSASAGRRRCSLVFDAVLVRPLPYADADRLVMVWDWETSETDITARHNSTPAEWIGGAASIPSSQNLACSQPADATLSGDGEPELVPARKVTWTFWSVLACSPCSVVPSPRRRTTRACASSSSATDCGNAIRRRTRHRRAGDLPQRRALRGDRRHAAELLLHALARDRHVDAGVVPAVYGTPCRGMTRNT